MEINPTVHTASDRRIEAPAYRVNFWERASADVAWNLDAWILSDAEEVGEVLDWIAAHSDGRRYELFVETEEPQISSFEEPRVANLVRLYGTNPNEE
jgi:hypothetical protein